MRPQDEDQPMNPDDVQASEEVGSCKSTSDSNTADTQRNGTRVDASASSIVVWALSEGEGNKPSAFSLQDGGWACCADCVNRLLLHGSIWIRGSTRCAPNVGSEISGVMDDGSHTLWNGKDLWIPRLNDLLQIWLGLRRFVFKSDQELAILAFKQVV